jgi:hypothetical protein
MAAAADIISRPIIIGWSVKVRAEWGYRVQVCRRMIAHQVDGPDADEDK